MPLCLEFDLEKKRCSFVLKSHTGATCYAHTAYLNELDNMQLAIYNFIEQCRVPKENRD